MQSLTFGASESVAFATALNVVLTQNYDVFGKKFYMALLRNVLSFQVTLINAIEKLIQKMAYCCIFEAFGKAMEPSAFLVGGLPRFLSETTFTTTTFLPSESTLGGRPLPLFATISVIIAPSFFRSSQRVCVRYTSIWCSYGHSFQWRFMARSKMHWMNLAIYTSRILDLGSQRFLPIYEK